MLNECTKGVLFYSDKLSSFVDKNPSTVQQVPAEWQEPITVPRWRELYVSKKRGWGTRGTPRRKGLKANLAIEEQQVCRTPPP